MKKRYLFIALAVVVAVAGYFIYKNWRHHFLRSRVPKLVYLESDSLYKISYDDVYLDEINGEIRIDNLRLTPDTTYKDPKDSSLPRKLMQVSIPEIYISQLRTDEALLNEEIVAGKLRLSAPDVIMYDNRYGGGKKSSDSAQDKDVYKAILRTLDRIKIDSIIISDATYSLVDWITRDTLLKTQHVSVNLLNLNISDSTSNDSSRVLFSKSAELEVDRMYIMGNKRYNYRFDSIAITSLNNSFTLKHIYIIPLLDEAAFARAVGYQLDRFNIDFNDIRFGNIRFRELLDGNVIADSLTIGYGMFKIARDRNYPRKDENKVGNYPQQALLKVPFDLSLGNVIVQNGYLEYKEKTKNGEGKIRFHDLRMDMKNATNRTSELERNNVLQVALHCNFLDAVPLSANISFYQHANGRFRADGTLGSADVTMFNQLLEPMAMASAKKGRLNKLSFDISGNDYNSDGKVTMLYQDLKVELLKRKDDNTIDDKDIMSFLANLKIKNDNPKGKRDPRIADIHYERDVHKSFFNLLWKSILTGIIETLGLNPEKIAKKEQKKNG